MEKNRLFSWKRFSSILKIDLMEQKKGLIIALSVILGIHFIIHLTSAFAGPREEVHIVFFANLLMVAGLIATSLSFRDFYTRDRAYFSLLLPASRFEKFLSRFLITTAGYVIGGVIVYFIYWLFAAGVSRAMFGIPFTVFNPFTPDLWKLIGAYIIVHSIFFFGAVYFRKGAYLKTLLSIIVLLIVLTIFASLVTALTAITWLDDLIPFVLGNVKQIQLPDSESLVRFLIVMGEITRIFVIFVLTPMLWLIGFLRFREIEVR